MLQNWLHPIEGEEIINLQLKDYQFGSKIQLNEGKLPSLRNTKIALIGIDETSNNSIRHELFQMSFPFNRLKIIDLGNVRKQEIGFITPLLKELLDSQILPILISPMPKLMLAQYKAHKSQQQLINLVNIAERIPFDPTEQDKKSYFLNEIVYGKRSKLLNLGLIGAQTHFVRQGVFDAINDSQYDCIRLGNARAQLSELEPILRDGDLVSFHLGALKRSEAPHQLQASPSGFTLEEACQISRYAGMSDKLKSFGIFGFNPCPINSSTAQSIAQMIWYFIDGFHNRKKDYPASTTGLIEYLVDFKDLDQPLTFWKSKKTGRWWMQVPVKTSKKYQQHRLIPCSIADYNQACQGDLSDRLFNAYKRFA